MAKISSIRTTERVIEFRPAQGGEYGHLGQQAKKAKVTK